MDTVLTQKFPFILDRNLAKAKCTGNRICMSCDKVVLGNCINHNYISCDNGHIGQYIQSDGSCPCYLLKK